MTKAHRDNRPSHEEKIEGDPAPHLLGRWIEEFFPVWADMPPYDRRHPPRTEDGRRSWA